MEINEKTVGANYFRALKKALQIRLNRKKIYNDNYSEYGKEGLFWLLMVKMIRLKQQHQKPINNNYEKEEDTLIDIINYAIFLLDILERGKQK